MKSRDVVLHRDSEWFVGAIAPDDGCSAYLRQEGDGNRTNTRSMQCRDWLRAAVIIVAGIGLIVSSFRWRI